MRIQQDLTRLKRWSILPAFDIAGYIAWAIVHGSFTAQLYLDVVKNQVLPLMGACGEPRSVLVIDNDRIHRSDAFVDMCADAGVEIRFLPPYSPDLNPIETSFALIKAYIRRNYEEVASYTEERGGFRAFLNDAIRDQAHSGNPTALFRAAGIEYEGRDFGFYSRFNV